ncbi:glycosyl hydrolase 115 family protein [Thalassobellus citreus]|uniref:glycosyl hydrolase 115 family protein n=1 Tax=Thalassobellus citreus TaxID=3367752 RepID=UPI0037A19EEB
MKRLKKILLILFLLVIVKVNASTEIPINCNTGNEFPLSVNGSDTKIYYDSNDSELIGITANLLSSDIEMITGISHLVTNNIDDINEYVVIIGTVSSNGLIKQLIDSGKIDVSQIENKWESYTIQTIDSPITGITKALVIIGSDRRGASFGSFELSKSIGVSPLFWWADVTPQQKDSLYVCPINFTSNEPTVKFRGIFINDEDWGLQEWSQYTFDPVQDIGPTTYEKIFELLLRLKANYIWPAMHPSTKPFNYYANNKVVADRYGIIMGSSHHEPLLYNTEEWPYSKSQWNPYTNLNTIMSVLESRVASNGQYENVYTMGIRGAGDSGIGGSLNDKTAKLEEVITLQRNLLTQYVNSDITQVPQAFWPYKEVLDQYNNNMDLPDDITLGWVDDNHGYIRQVSNPEEQLRSGGSGVYYHLSYWGSPADYLWIASTPPALIATEMKKAADFGGDRIWIFNVGDIKPAEMLMNFSLDLAYDYNKWDASNVNEYINEWATFNFGAEYADDITSAYALYFQLAQNGKPEHIDRLKFPDSEIEYRLNAYREISNKVEATYSQIPDDLKDAFFEMVYYPIRGADYMNQKFLYAYKSFSAAAKNDPIALQYSETAKSAHAKIKEITTYYNTGIKDGKWNKIISSDIRSQNVYDMPRVATQADIDKEHADVIDINLSEGTFISPMKYENGVVMGNKSGALLSPSTGGKAEFSFEIPQSINADIYFFVRTPSVEEDSWHVNINGTQFIQNNYATGETFEWIKVNTLVLPSGTNTITISQREPNAQIAAIKIAEPGLVEYSSNYVLNPSLIIPAWEFDKMTNSQGFTWEVIEGLSSSEKAVVNLPYTASSINNVDLAPYIEKEISLKQKGFSLEVRCLPTRRLYEGRDLRMAISINDETPKVISIQQPYPSLDWEKNVIRGYVKSSMSYLAEGDVAKIRLYALDPGIIFDKVLIYYDGDTLSNTEPLENEVKLFSVFPNPFKENFTCKFKGIDSKDTDIILLDITGKQLQKHRMTNKHANEGITVSTSNLSKGVYLVKATTKEGATETKIIIKD